MALERALEPPWEWSAHGRNSSSAARPSVRPLVRRMAGRMTAPTALIPDQASLFAAAQQHLAQRCIQAPQHVSLACTDPGPAFACCQPTITHIRWDTRPVVRRVVRWTANLC
ncbi:MAG: substrate-binding domain-containing protein [Verrucomicrobia bacterium]|nr:substrate-binding domain-containing protein [Verrucomicrobiota bacterium]